MFLGGRLDFQRRESQGLGIVLEGVSARGRHGEKILQPMSLRIAPGELVGVIGPSGCGKSSLIQRIVGLAAFSEGTMRVNGRPVAAV